jgi:hypothetical protein
VEIINMVNAKLEELRGLESFNSGCHVATIQRTLGVLTNNILLADRDMKWTRMLPVYIEGQFNGKQCYYSTSENKLVKGNGLDISKQMLASATLIDPSKWGTDQSFV